MERLDGVDSRKWVGVCAAFALVVAAFACHTPPVQRVRLHVEPADAQVFVDGAPLAAGTAWVELRSDRPHVVLSKRDGYRPAQTVLETRSVDGRPRLAPAEIRVRLEPLVPKESGFRIEGED